MSARRWCREWVPGVGARSGYTESVPGVGAPSVYPERAQSAPSAWREVCAQSVRPRVACPPETHHVWRRDMLKVSGIWAVCGEAAARLLRLLYRGGVRQVSDPRRDDEVAALGPDAGLAAVRPAPHVRGTIVRPRH